MMIKLDKRTDNIPLNKRQFLNFNDNPKLKSEPSEEKPLLGQKSFKFADILAANFTA